MRIATSLSSSAAPRRAAQGPSPAQSSIISLWHALCIPFLASGCYFGPIELLDSNAPPVIKDSNYLNGETIVIEQERQFIYVFVQDEEPELLTFNWTLSLDGIVPDAERYLDGRSQVSLSNENEFLDGQLLRCVISDGSQTAAISWPLEVIQ